MDERRVEELLRERARRRADDPLGPGASARVLDRVRRERARRRSSRWLVSGLALAAAAGLLAGFFLFFGNSGLERTDHGALPLEVALLDAAGRPLDPDPQARGPEGGFARPGEVVVELVPTGPGAEGHWWTFVYDPRGRRHDGRSGRFDGAAPEALWPHALDRYEAAAEGDSIVTFVVVAAREPVPDPGAHLPPEVGAGAERRALLREAVETMRARTGCTVVLRELVLERAP